MMLSNCHCNQSLIIEVATTITSNTSRTGDVPVIQVNVLYAIHTDTVLYLDVYVCRHYDVDSHTYTMYIIHTYIHLI